MKVIDIINYLDELIPTALSETWDRDGISVIPDKSAETEKVVVSLDVTSNVIAKAKELGANLIVSHHPLIFEPLSSVDFGNSIGKRVVECIKNNIAVFSLHTRLDECDGGVNDNLAAFIGIRNLGRLGKNGGRICMLDEITDFNSFSEHLKKIFPDSNIRAVKNCETINKIGICSGSCMESMLAEAVESGCDTFITGEAKHSYLISAKELGLNMFCVSHHETENVVLNFLENTLKKIGIEVIKIPFITREEYGV